MLNLVLAALAFAGIHLLISGTRLRDGLVARLGDGPYRGLFSLASAGALTWLILAYSKLRVPEPTPLLHWRGIADLLVLTAFLLVVFGLLTPSPTVVGGEKLLGREGGATGIHRITRHPFLWGVALWAATHIVFNFAPIHVVFFGTFVVVAVAGTASIDHKRARLFGDAWQRYAAQTSNVPFVAIVQGRNRLAWAELGAWKLLAAVGAYLLALGLHARVFGVSPF